MDILNSRFYIRIVEEEQEVALSFEQVAQCARYLKAQTTVSLYVGKPFKFMIGLAPLNQFEAKRALKPARELGTPRGQYTIIRIEADK